MVVVRLPVPKLDWLVTGALYAQRGVSLPNTTTMYYMTKGVRWQEQIVEFSADGRVWVDRDTQPVGYEDGRRYDVRWGGAVAGPSVAPSPMHRYPEGIAGATPLFVSGAPGHAGTGDLSSAHTTFYRNGQKIDESDTEGSLFVALPDEPADYRLNVVGTRDYADLSTRVSATWTFRSAGTDEISPVPLVGVRFNPAVDLAGSAPAGVRYPIPLALEGVTGGVSALAVQVSFDDGATWQPASVSQSHGSWRAVVTHPAGNGHVSLRAQLTDGNGSGFDVTVIRAYRIG